MGIAKTIADTVQNGANRLTDADTKKLAQDYITYLRGAEDGNVKTIDEFVATSTGYAADAVATVKGVFKESLSSATEQTKGLAGKLIEGGRGILNLTPSDVNKAGETAGHFMEENKGSMLGSIIGLVLGIALGGMESPLMMLALLAIGMIGGGMMDPNGGILGALGFGGNQTPPPGTGPAPAPAVTGPQPVQVKRSDPNVAIQGPDGKILSGFKDGKPTYDTPDATREVSIVMTDDAGNQIRSFKGKVKLEGNKPVGFIVTSIQEELTGGGLGPETDVSARPESERFLSVGADGKVNFDSPSLLAARGDAAAKARVYEKKVEREVVAGSTAPGSNDIKFEYGQVDLNVPDSTPPAKKSYKVVLKGHREGDKAVLDTAVLIDPATGQELKDDKGNAIEYKFEKVPFDIKKGKAGTPLNGKDVVEFTEGRIPEFGKTAGDHIVQKKHAEIKEKATAREAETADFVKSLSEAPAGTVEAAMLDKWKTALEKQMGGDSLTPAQKAQATAAAMEIAAKYKDPAFLAKDPAIAAAEIQGVVTAKGLKRADNTAIDVTDLATRVQEGIQKEKNRTNALSDKEVDKAELQLLAPDAGRSEAVKKAVNSMTGAADGYVILTPNAKDGDLGEVIYAKKAADGSLTDIQVAKADGTLVRVTDKPGAYNANDPAQVKAVIDAANSNDATKATALEGKDTVVDDIRVPLTRMDKQAAVRAQVK